MPPPTTTQGLLGIFPARPGSARHQPTQNNPARPISDIFVPTDNIGGRGRGKERKERGERPQGPAGGGGENNSRERTEQRRMGKGTRRGREAAENYREGGDDGGGGVQVTGPRQTGEKQQRQGGAPQGQPRGM